MLLAELPNSLSKLLRLPISKSANSNPGATAQLTKQKEFSSTGLAANQVLAGIVACKHFESSPN